MNECDGVALPMPKFVEGSGQPLADFNVPCLIQPDMQQRNMFEANADVKVFMHDVFEREFTKPVAGAGKAMERAQKPMPLQIKTMVVRRVDAMLGQPCHDWSSASPALAKAVEPLAVIVSKNHEAITPEKFYLPSVRFCVSGARDIVMVRVSEFSDYCKTKLEEGVSVTSRILKDTLKGMDKVQIEEYVKQGKKLYYASAGAGAAVYCPAAWLFVERYNGTSLWLGFKTTVTAATLQMRSDIASLRLGLAHDGPILDDYVSMLDGVLNSSLAPLAAVADAKKAGSAGSHDLGADDSQEEADAKKQEADAKKQEAADAKKQEADLEKQEADAKKQESDAKQEEADAKKQEADSEKQESDSKKQEEADLEKQEADAEKQHADLEKQEADAKKEESDAKQPEEAKPEAIAMEPEANA